MATTFVKNGSNVLVTIGDKVYSVPGAAFITPHPSEEDAILISANYNPQDREALKIFVSEVTTPEATDRNDLIETLSTDFFFSTVTGTSVLVGNFRMISTDAGLRIDKKLTATGFAGVEDTDWQTLNIFN